MVIKDVEQLLGVIVKNEWEGSAKIMSMLANLLVDDLYATIVVVDDDKIVRFTMLESL